MEAFWSNERLGLSGATVPIPLVIADLLGIPVVRPAVTETTALGAAYLAGLATGFWSGADEIAGQWQQERRFEPEWGAAQRHEVGARWREAVDRSRSWARR